MLPRGGLTGVGVSSYFFGSGGGLESLSFLRSFLKTQEGGKQIQAHISITSEVKFKQRMLIFFPPIKTSEKKNAIGCR